MVLLLHALVIATCSLATSPVASAEPNGPSRKTLMQHTNPEAAAKGRFASAPVGASGRYGLDSGTPPRGWNSYDSFTWFVNETQFLRNCKYMADHLLDYGCVRYLDMSVPACPAVS